MRRWEEDRRVRIFREKIKRAKATIHCNAPLPPLRSPAAPSQTQSAGRSSSLCAYLRHFQLQQYFPVHCIQKLRTLTKACDSTALALLSPEELEEVLDRLKLMPGHRLKFVEMIEDIRSALRDFRDSRGNSTAGASAPQDWKRPLSIETVKSPAAPVAAKNQQLLAEVVEARQKIIELEGKLSSCVPQPVKAQTPIVKPRKMTDNRGDIGKSFDSAKLRATLGNLDLEEMCRCLARAVKSMDNGRYGAKDEEAEEVFAAEGSDAMAEVDIYNFIKNALISNKSDKEVAVVMFIYLQRVQETGVIATPQTWKRVAYTAMVLADKAWRGVPSIFPIFTPYSQDAISRMCAFYESRLSGGFSFTTSDFAQGYFRLLGHSQPHGSQLRSIDSMRKMQRRSLHTGFPAPADL